MPRAPILDPPSLGPDVARYAVATTVVAALGLGAAFLAGRGTPDQEATEIVEAVTVELPPAMASSQPASDAAEGPEQEAAQATAAQAAPEQQAPPKPVDDPQPSAPPTPVEAPPVQPDPPAVLERQHEEATPSPTAAPTATQEERAPAGSQATTDTDGDERERPHASAHAITLWQRAMVQKLQSAKHAFTAAAVTAGTVRVAFAIDATGALESERVAATSGSASLDRAALQLVRQAAPFPAPPPGSGRGDMSFVVPIRFR